MKNFAKRISALVLAVVVSAAVLCPAAFAAQLPSLPKDQCVVDGAGVLSSSTVQTITELNAQLESSCSGAQIGVLTVEYTGNDSTEDYATQAFNAWGIGSSSKNNGVLILLVMESAQYADGDYYLTYGDGFRNTNGIISVPEYEGATASSAGTSGLVPPAAAGQHESFLTGGGEYKPALTKISDSVNLADSKTAASAKAVKTTYDLANSKQANLGFTPVQQGGGAG